MQGVRQTEGSKMIPHLWPKPRSGQSYIQSGHKVEEEFCLVSSLKNILNLNVAVSNGR